MAQYYLTQATYAFLFASNKYLSIWSVPLCLGHWYMQWGPRDAAFRPSPWVLEVSGKPEGQASSSLGKAEKRSLLPGCLPQHSSVQHGALRAVIQRRKGQMAELWSVPSPLRPPQHSPSTTQQEPEPGHLSVGRSEAISGSVSGAVSDQVRGGHPGEVWTDSSQPRPFQVPAGQREVGSCERPGKAPWSGPGPSRK